MDLFCDRQPLGKPDVHSGVHAPCSLSATVARYPRYELCSGGDTDGH